MTKIKNSLSTYLEQAMVMTGNSLETIDKISNAVSSSEDSVKLILTDPNDPKKTVEYVIPSFGYLKSDRQTFCEYQYNDQHHRWCW